MNNKHALTAAILTLLLTGCGGTDVGNGVAAPSVPPAAEPTPEPEPTTAAPTQEPPKEVTEEPTEEITEEPTEEPTTEAPAVETSVRGNLVKDIGEAAGILGENGEPLATFVVNSITPDVICTEDYVEPAQNGVFLAVDVSVQTSPAMAEPDSILTSFDMSSAMFRTIAPNGTSSNASADTSATLFCLDDSVLLPSSIGPGENVRGIVLLDVETPSGILIYEDYWTDSGWEWNYPG